MPATRLETLNKAEMMENTFDLAYLERFTLAPDATEEEQKLLAEITVERLRRHSLGLVIGRFQPLHYGHIYLLKQALAVADAIVIGIGSSNVRDADNPFSIEQRERMLQLALKREQLDKRVFKIVTLPDYPDDVFWLKETLRRTGDIDVVIGNNSWVNGIFEQASYQVMRVPFLRRYEFEGKRIRQLLREAGKLPDRLFRE